MSTLRRRVLTTLTTLAIAGIAIVVVLTTLAWWQQERIVFQPPRVVFPRPAVTRVDYRASDGQPLFAYVVEGPPPTADAVAGDVRGRRVLLAFHGNADLAGWQVPWAQAVAARTGATVMLAEYRGYAGLPGTPTYAGSRLDARAAWAHLVDSLGAAPGDVAIYGHSLGSAVASELAAALAAERPAGERPRRLVLVAPFTSAREMARRIVAPPVLLAWGLISRVHYDTRARVAALDVAVWVSHGEEDLIIPVRMGREVFDAAKVKGELLLVAGAGHNDVADVGGARYWQWLERALR